MPISIGDNAAALPVHTHDAASVTSGTLGVARIPDLASMWTIDDHGLLAAVDMPHFANQTATPTSGQLRCCRIRVPNDLGKVTGMVLGVSTAGSSATAAYMGIYNGAGTSLLAATPNTTSIVTAAAGARTVAFSSALNSLAAGEYILAFTITASTMPQILAVSGNIVMPNVGRAATVAGARSFGANTSQSLPASLTFSAFNGLYWMGLY